MGNVKAGKRARDLNLEGLVLVFFGYHRQISRILSSWFVFIANERSETELLFRLTIIALQGYALGGIPPPRKAV